MSRRTQHEIDTLVTIAAGIFATYTRDAKVIAELLNTTERNIYRWAEREKWDEVLKILKYDGQRNFRVQKARDAQRENADVFDTVKAAYDEARAQGIPYYKRATRASQLTGVPSRNIRDWARKFKWDTP